MNPNQESTRRNFLASTGKAALAGAVIATPAAASDPKKKPDTLTGHLTRHAIPGSPSTAYSRAMQLGQLIFIAGCVGRYQKGGEAAMDKDFESQATQTMLNLKASIEASGSGMDKVLKCTCFLKEQSDFAKFNEVYMKFFPEPRPARSTVVVKDFVVPGALLEVDCECHL
ncbi:MAG: RidA family protein [Planctomycetes bacterium]|nr:RidA family protein [Planctomycetota bacterium]